MPPSNEDLQSQLKELSLEVRSLREEVERLKGAPLPAPEPPPKPKFEPIKSSPLSRSVFKEEPKLEPVKAAEPEPGPQTFDDLVRKAKGLPPVHRVEPAPAREVEDMGIFSNPLSEKFIGEKMLQYVGTLILGLGVVFFLIWRAQHTSPAERAFMATAAGAALVALGAWVRSRPPYDRLSEALIGGGWSVLYITAYAVFHFPAVKIVDSTTVEMALLLASAGGMVFHALSTGSRALRLYSFSLAYFLLLFCRADVASFDLFLVLLGASALISVESGEADVLIPSLLGFHANYLPTYFHTIGLPAADRTMANFTQPFGWLAGGYLIVALLPLIPRARTKLMTEEQKTVLDGVLCLNASLFAVIGASMGRVYWGHASLQRAAMMSLFFLLPATGHLWALGRRSMSASLGGVIPLMLLAAAIFEMPDPMWKLFAWVGVSTGWVFIGLFLDQPVWRAAGLAMSVLTFFFYWEVAGRGEEPRRAAAMALFVFAATSYFFSRFHRLWLDDPEEWEKPSSEYWLHIGTASLILGLWGTLDAAPFLCSLVALALIGEHLAVRLGRTGLWAQASALELALGIYFFFVDYGAGSSVTALSPRLLVGFVVAGAYAYLLFDDPMDDALAEKWTWWNKAEQRRVVSWLLLGVLSFAVYKEFDGRLRLPIWAFGSLGLYWLGKTSKTGDFEKQSLVLSLATGVEALTTYMTAPAPLMAQLSFSRAALYWASVAALGGGLFSAKTAEEGKTDDMAALMFSVLALVLGAAFFAKEMDRVQLTLAWTGLGIAFLGGGLVLGWRELRLPGLCLLAVCVGKALLSDTAHMPLPNRVASFVVLGVVLIFASSLYNRAGARGE